VTADLMAESDAAVSERGYNTGSRAGPDGWERCRGQRPRLQHRDRSRIWWLLAMPRSATAATTPGQEYEVTGFT